MPRKSDEKKTEPVRLWSGHDVNLTIPTDYGMMGHRFATATPTLGQLREFVRLAQDAGYTDGDYVLVDVAGLKVRRGGVA